MTRTKKVREKKYPKPFTVRATMDEHERLMKRAKSAQLSLSRFLVECGLSNEAPSWEASQHERTLVQIVRAGNNLNQIAKRLNSQRGIIEYSNLEQTLSAIIVALKEIQEYKR